MSVNKQQLSNEKKMIGVYQFCYKSGKFLGSYESIREAERQTNIKGSDISLCCRGKIKHAGKCIWIRIKDYL